MPAQLYDNIGLNYSRRRRQDARIAAAIHAMLNGCDSVINVGAGTASYEPETFPVIAVEPSRTMIRQRPPTAAPVVQAVAAQLPFADASFDCAMALLTIHHWPDPEQGLRELLRVARRKILLLTFDPAAAGFWLTQDYFPRMLELDRNTMPAMAWLCRILGRVNIRPVLIPHDCSDGFLGAYWRRPQTYLDPEVRAAISTFARVPEVESGLSRLRQELSDGSWHRKYASLLTLTELDVGYRLVEATL